MSLIEKMNWRTATKKFDPSKKLTEEQVTELLELLNLTPTSYGGQFQNVVVVENKELREQLVPVSWGQKQVVDASHLLVLCSELNVGAERVEKFMDRIVEVRGVERSSLDGYRDMLVNAVSNEGAQTWHDKQTYITLGNLMTSAAYMGIDACPMEGFDAAKYDEILGLTEKGLKSVLVVPIGHRAEDDMYAKLPKVRKELNDFVIKI